MYSEDDTCLSDISSQSLEIFKFFDFTKQSRSIHVRERERERERERSTIQGK
jgi:hypothetical protein